MYPGKVNGKQPLEKYQPPSQHPNFDFQSPEKMSKSTAW
jgi:hypothetical protein